MSREALGGKPIDDWRMSHPLLTPIMAGRETWWFNPSTVPAAEAWPHLDLPRSEMEEAAGRFRRFAPYLRRAFPETDTTGGRLCSPLSHLTAYPAAWAGRYGVTLPGRLLLKGDHALPIAGSIKARGGIHEVLKHAEALALEAGLLRAGDDYAALTDDRFRRLFAGHALAVGSTGNLGLSIGLIGARLGFQVTVHMSADARAWKKALLRSRGVKVIEHTQDYSHAVREGRRRAAEDPRCHFVDDEASRDLFFGYATAGEEVRRQLAELRIPVDEEHPLFVYLPCGVGGGPGGVAFGLKQAFGDAVHCLFAEPTASPCMLLGLYTGLQDAICVQDVGLDNRTAADGLAVGRPSGLVCRQMGRLIDGVYTVSDAALLRHLTLLADTEGIRIEPSAAAGLAGVTRIANHPGYLEKHGLVEALGHATHLAWSTGGGLVPAAEMAAYLSAGRQRPG